MEIKKSKKADITKKTGFFTSIGFVLAFLIVITGFEWKSHYDGASVILDDPDWAELPLVQITIQPPKSPPPPKVSPVFEEVREDVPDEPVIEIDQGMELTPPEPVIDHVPELIVEDPDSIHVTVETPAEPFGGFTAFYQYVKENMNYPRHARRTGIEGKVFVQFVVNKDGVLSDVKAIKGIGGGCDEEAVRVISSHPAWSPPKQRGKPVRQLIVLPITFKLK